MIDNFQAYIAQVEYKSEVNINTKGRIELENIMNLNTLHLSELCMKLLHHTWYSQKEKLALTKLVNACFSTYVSSRILIRNIAYNLQCCRVSNKWSLVNQCISYDIKGNLIQFTLGFKHIILFLRFLVHK